MKKIYLLLCCQSGSEYLNRLSQQHKFFYTLLAIIVLSILVSPRFIHLDADPHPSFIPSDTGYKIDEGYKTLAPKNLLIFGKTSWHSSDTYIGWMKTSPVTQWPYYYAFKVLGLELKNARLISAIYFVLFMVVAFYFLIRRYTITIALTGTILLASEPALFYFSRSALFETAMILFVYTSILLTTRIDHDKPLHAVIGMIIIMFIAAFTIKQSAIIYFFPPIVACSFLVAINTKRSSWRNTIYITVLLMSMLLIVFVTRNIWLQRIDINYLLDFPKAFLMNPMPDFTPLSLLLGYSCILHLLLVKPKKLYDNIYRFSLVSIVVAGPIILSLLEYHPSRYFIPIIPSCLLLNIEWLRMKSWKLCMLGSFTTLQKFTIAVFFIMFSMLLLRAFEILILRNLSFAIGENVGIAKITLFKLFPFFLAGVFGFYYMVRSNAVRILGYLIPLLTLTSIVVGLSAQAMTLLHLSYDSQTIRATLNDMVADTESIAGDWAPFFTAEAPIPSIFMTEKVNMPTPNHLDKIRPDYFLSSNTLYDQRSQALLESNDQIRLSTPQMIGTYRNHDISIYRIKYLNSK